MATEHESQCPLSMRGPDEAGNEPVIAPRIAAVKTRTKEDLIREVCLHCELPVRQGSAVVDTIFNSIQESLQAGGRVELRRFGVFSTHKRGARRGRDPRSGAEVKVPAKLVGKFTPSKTLRQFVDGKPED